MITPWYDQYGYYCTGFDAHVQAYRWYRSQLWLQRNERMNALSKVAR